MSLTVEQMEFLQERGLSLSDVIDFARLNETTPTDQTNAERQARYRARHDLTPTQWQAIRSEVLKRDNYTCTYCGSVDYLCCDHVVPLIQGGKSTLENLTTACRACNSGKSGRTPEEWKP